MKFYILFIIKKKIKIKFNWLYNLIPWENDKTNVKIGHIYTIKNEQTYDLKYININWSIDTRNTL